MIVRGGAGGVRSAGTTWRARPPSRRPVPSAGAPCDRRAGLRARTFARMEVRTSSRVCIGPSPRDSVGRGARRRCLRRTAFGRAIATAGAQCTRDREKREPGHPSPRERAAAARVTARHLRDPRRPARGPPFRFGAAFVFSFDAEAAFRDPASAPAAPSCSSRVASSASASARDSSTRARAVPPARLRLHLSFRPHPQPRSRRPLRRRSRRRPRFPPGSGCTRSSTAGSGCRTRTCTRTYPRPATGRRTSTFTIRTTAGPGSSRRGCGATGRGRTSGSMAR